MSNLRNPGIRNRDVRKLVEYKSQEITWDRGCDEKSEWVFASLENETYLGRLINWLSSKNIALKNEAVLVDNTWTNLQMVCWGDFIESPKNYFGKEMFQLYDLDLNWLMEYQTQEIARFGRYSNHENA